MDSRRPVTNSKDKRKRGKSNINPVQTHCMETRRKAQEQAVFKRRKQETDPFKMGHILETIFSFLDADSIKAARQVDPLWSIEGAKSLITKCYVKIPGELQVAGSSKKKTKMDKFKLFLSHKAKDFPVITNIIVEAPGDLELWKSLGVLGQQVKSLKLNNIDKEAELLQNLLDLLPNLKYLEFEKKNVYENRSAIIKVISSTMSKREKDGSSLTVSILPLDPSNEEELTDMEMLSDCKNVIIEHLASCYSTPDILNIEVRLTNVLSKLLLTSQNAVKKLTMYNCVFYFSLIEFPCMPVLVHLDLNFGIQLPGISPDCKFPPSFRFSEKMPNLQEINTDFARIPYLQANTDILQNLLENTGTAPSVKRVSCCGNFVDCAVDALFRAFPNTKDLHVCLNSTSVAKFRALWTNGRNLKNLHLHIDLLPFMGNGFDLDLLFSGFDAETVNKIKETPNLDPYTSEELQELRVNPSVFNLKELEHLAVHVSDIYAPVVPKRMFTVAAKHEINLLPKDPRICITFENTYGFKDALDEVSKFHNINVHFKNDIVLSDLDSASDGDSD